MSERPELSDLDAPADADEALKREISHAAHLGGFQFAQRKGGLFTKREGIYFATLYFTVGNELLAVEEVAESQDIFGDIDGWGRTTVIYRGTDISEAVDVLTETWRSYKDQKLHWVHGGASQLNTTRLVEKIAALVEARERAQSVGISV